MLTPENSQLTYRFWCIP